jgi:NADPH2:quinone reductase
MRAVVCKAFCEPRDLVIEELPALNAGPGQVVIAVRACGVNFPDGLTVQGKYQHKPPFPFVPGAELSGIVKEVGAGVQGLTPGMRVMAFAGLGGYAEEARLDAWRVFPIPDAMDFVAAAGFLITYATSHHGLKDQARLKAGETLLVLGAAGGVGLTAVELGHVMGARVIAAASSAEKLALAKSYGASELINYADEDLRERLKQLTGGAGIDVIYDPVGGKFTEPAIRSLAWKGRHLVIGFAAGDIPKIPINLFLLKMASMHGVFWGQWASREPAAAAANVAELLDWYAQGRLRPHIQTTYPLERAGEALELVMNRGAQGKVVIVTDRT